MKIIKCGPGQMYPGCSDRMGKYPAHKQCVVRKYIDTVNKDVVLYLCDNQFNNYHWEKNELYNTPINRYGFVDNGEYRHFGSLGLVEDKDKKCRKIK
jgi:hypothetical protein